MQDKDMPNRTSNKSKAEGERWESDADTVERGHGQAGGVDRVPGRETESAEGRDSATDRSTPGVGTSTTERKEVE